MDKLDPGLKFLSKVKKAEARVLAEESIFNVESADAQPSTATILIQFTGDFGAIESAGFRPRSVIGDIATGEANINRIDEIAALPNLVRIEVSRVLHRELDLALVETRANLVHSGPPGNRGSGVIVGIIDSGIDYTHPAFRRNDGTSRILAIWDQRLLPQGAEHNPTNFNYGVEYTKADIDAALVSANPLAVVRHQDFDSGGGFHGTHVAGIAAGDGSIAGQGQPANTFVGVAPEADIIVVANTRGRASGERGLGDSADTLDAASYIFDFAATLRRPVVINQSQGDNIGPHDGTSLLERGLDNLLGTQGRAMVKSAGNEGNRRCHASGTVLLGGVNTPSVNIPTGRVAPVSIDIWYRATDRLAITITPPGGVATAPVVPGNSPTLNLPNGNQVFVDSVTADPGNGDNRIFLIIQRGTQAVIAPGVWNIALQGTTIVSGQWDGWIQRGEPRPEFLAPFTNPARTISIPGTAQKIITAASYITRGAGVGSISTFSSLGPTRDGRQAPTVAAPGQQIISVQPTSTGDAYGPMSGTSMAAPMITGAIALALEKNPNLTQEEIRTILTNTARSDAFTSATPNNAWGAGKLDVQAAFQQVPGVLSPRTLTPPCIPQTILPPCVLRTLTIPCPPRTLTPPCLQQTILPPCPPRTLAPPCIRPTLFPPCLRPTLAPPCPQPTLGPPCGGFPGGFRPPQPFGSSAGRVENWNSTADWPYAQGAWPDPSGWAGAYGSWGGYNPQMGEAWFDPAWMQARPAMYQGAGWFDPYQAAGWYGAYQADPASWSQPGAQQGAQQNAWGDNAGDSASSGFDVAYWYGNTGYS